MPYHFVVDRITRVTWNKIDSGDLDARWRMAVDDLAFTFVGDTPFGCDVVGRDEFRSWLHDFVGRFESISFTVEDVAVAGWPWRTRVAARLRVRGTFADGSSYENMASQWITLRWGKMTEDWVLEDTKQLDQAFAGQVIGETG